jgi:hypothetical protein
MFSDGTPFFYLGDTGWELFHRLSYSEAEKYLENRRQKGFTVIQAVILAELDGLNTPNRNGDRPLINNDPQRPNESYFAFVDSVIRLAEGKGIFIGLLPTWGDKVDKSSWGTGPVIFNPENALAYGKYVGGRYKDFPNIIWINGGDRPGGRNAAGTGDNFPVWDALGKGIKSADPNHLMTYHPWGEKSSSAWFHNCEWLDFNMAQTGHGQRSYAIYRITWPYLRMSSHMANGSSGKGIRRVCPALLVRCARPARCQPDAECEETDGIKAYGEQASFRGTYSEPR